MMNTTLRLCAFGVTLLATALPGRLAAQAGADIRFVPTSNSTSPTGISVHSPIELSLDAPNSGPAALLVVGTRLASVFAKYTDIDGELKIDPTFATVLPVALDAAGQATVTLPPMPLANSRPGTSRNVYAQFIVASPGRDPEILPLLAIERGYGEIRGSNSGFDYAMLFDEADGLLHWTHDHGLIPNLNIDLRVRRPGHALTIPLLALPAGTQGDFATTIPFSRRLILEVDACSPLL